MTPQMLVNFDQWLLGLAALGANMIQKTLLRRMRAIGVEAVSEHVAVARLVGGVVDSSEVSTQPGHLAAREQVPVQLPCCQRPPDPDTQLMHILDVLIGFLRSQR
jgi:hypothetical protein